MRRYFSSLRAKIKLSLLGKPNCCLCDQADFALQRMLANVDPAIREQVDLEKVNIEDDSELMTEYSQTIPVVLMDGEVLMESKIDPSSVRHAILARLRLHQ